MSAWGTGSFENDSALDWMDKLEDYRNIDLIKSTLVQAIDNDLVIYGDGFVDTAAVDTAIAAAEVVAALKDHPSEFLPTPIKEWIRNHNIYIDDNILELAIRVIKRASNTYELRDLWADPTEHNEWKRVVEDLRLRLEM